MDRIFYNQDQVLKGPRLNINIVEVDGLIFLSEIKSTNGFNEIYEYNPSTFRGINKSPRKAIENNEDSPRVALANLDSRNIEDVLSFTNTWGLLDLQNISFFEEVSFEERKGIQYQDLFRNSSSSLKREPLFLFQMACNHYHKLLNLLHAWETLKQKQESEKQKHDNENIQLVDAIKANINQIIRSNVPRLTSSEDCKSFEYTIFNNSLFGSIYALTAEELINGLMLKMCINKRCGIYFRPTRSDKKYCSGSCNDAVRSDNMRTKAKAKKEILYETQSVNEENLAAFFKRIKADGYLNRNEIKQMFYEYLKRSDLNE